MSQATNATRSPYTPTVTSYTATDVVRRYVSPIATPSVPAGEPAARAVTNVRKHMIRAAVRRVTLLSFDLAAIALTDAAIDRLLASGASLRPLRDAFHLALPGGHFASGQVIVGLLLALAITGNYGAGDRRRDPARLFLGCAFGLALPIWGALWTTPVAALSQYAISVPLLALALSLSRGMLDLFTRYAIPLRAAAPRTLLVGPGADCLEMLGRSAFSDEFGFSLVGIVDTTDTSAPDGGNGRADPLGNLEQTLLEKQVDTIVLCGPTTDALVIRTLRAATIGECEVLSATRVLELPGVSPELVWRQKQPFLDLRPAELRGHQLIAKRVLDVVVASVSLVLLAPLMALIAAAVRLESSGPAVFGQARMGRHGKIFRCLKFRSMKANAEAILRSDPELYAEYVRNDFKLPPERDTRITRMGRFLRRTSLDELPQLWNVLRGEMSLVGPRPVVVDELTHYGTEKPVFLSLKPGVTGAWQVNGRSSVPYPDRAMVELEYVRSWSLGRDLQILLQTVPAVLAQRGAH